MKNTWLPSVIALGSLFNSSLFMTAGGESGNDISGLYRNPAVVKIVLDTHDAWSADEFKCSSTKKSIAAEGLYSLRISYCL